MISPLEVEERNAEKFRLLREKWSNQVVTRLISEELRRDPRKIKDVTALFLEQEFAYLKTKDTREAGHYGNIFHPNFSLERFPEQILRLTGVLAETTQLGEKTVYMAMSLSDYYTNGIGRSYPWTPHRLDYKTKYIDDIYSIQEEFQKFMSPPTRFNVFGILAPLCWDEKGLYSTVMVL